MCKSFSFTTVVIVFFCYIFLKLKWGFLAAALFLRIFKFSFLKFIIFYGSFDYLNTSFDLTFVFRINN